MKIYFIIMALVALALVSVGLLLWKKNKVNLIHAYHLARVEDLAGYSAAMGKSLVAFGLFIFFTGVLALLAVPPVVITWAMVVGCLGFIANFCRIQKKYSGSWI